MNKKIIKSLFWLNLVVILFFWFSGSSGHLLERSFSGIFISLGRVSGLLAEYLILVQLILIGRIHFIEREFGHDRLASIHKTVGTYLILLIISHPILLSVGYGALTESGYFEQFLSFLQNWDDVAPALLGLLIFAAATILSLTVFRAKLKYERWHFTHLFIYLAIGLALEHQTKTGDMSSGLPMFYWLALNYIAFGLILLYRFLRPFIQFFKYRFRVQKVEAESGDVWSIYITGKNIGKFSYEAGQFAIVNFLQKGLWTSHPFSISCAPNPDHIRFTIKELGDYTKRIKELRPGTLVLIDGPLGLFTAKAAHTKKFLFVAGGIGITPIFGIIESLVKKNTRDIILLYCVRSAAMIPFQKDLDLFPIRSYYIISDGVHVNAGKHLSGKLDKERLKKLAPDLLERDVYFCGPPAMGTAVLNDLKELGVQKDRLHYEKFAF